MVLIQTRYGKAELTQIRRGGWAYRIINQDNSITRGHAGSRKQIESDARKALRTQFRKDI